MRRVLCFILALLMAMTLISCGSESKKQEAIITGTWTNIENGSTIVFKEGGSAVFTYIGEPSQDYKWSLSDNEIKLEGSTDIVRYTLVSEDEITYIENVNSGTIFVSSDSSKEIHEKLTNELRQKRVDSANVINIKQLWSELATNIAKATTDYSGKYGVLTVTVMNINKNYFEWMAMHNGYMTTVHVDMPTEDIAKLHDGEGITVCGMVNILSDSLVYLTNTFVADDYVGDIEQTSVDHQYLIDNFDGDPYHVGRISWTAGSLAYFTTNYGVLHKVTLDEFNADIVGKQWNAKYYAEANLEITVLLNVDGTAIETEDGKVKDWKWEYTSYLHLPATRQTNYEVRKVDDSMYIIYSIEAGEAMPHWLFWQDE